MNRTAYNILYLMPKSSSVVYAIAKGRTTGIVSTWEECKLHTRHYPGAKFKSFRGEGCKARALEWLRGAKDLVLTKPSDEGRKFVYTDGSCINNGTPKSSGGIGIYYEDGTRISRPLPKSYRQTNNVAELEAILVVLRDQVNSGCSSDITIVSPSNITPVCPSNITPVRPSDITPVSPSDITPVSPSDITPVSPSDITPVSPSDITIVTDSEYSIREISNTHERSGDYPNKSLICEARDLIARLPGVALMHVRAHTGKLDRHSVGNSIADQLALEAARHAGN